MTTTATRSRRSRGIQSLQRKEIASRRALVKQLVDLGLSGTEIEKYVSSSCINDLRRLSKTMEIPSRSLDIIERRDTAYQNAMRRYAEICTTPDPATDRLRQVLHSFLNIEKLMAFCSGLVAGLDTLITGASESPVLDTYKRLAMQILEIDIPEITANRLLSEYLTAIVSGEVAPVSRKETPESIRQWALSKLAVQQSPLRMTWPAARFLDSKLHTLAAREEETIREAFGLSTGTKTPVAHIGEDAGCSRERIRQVILQGMRRLRHPSRRPEGLRLFTMSFQELNQSIVDSWLAIEFPTPQDRPIQFALSAKACKMLRPTRIRTLADLAACTAEELQRSAGFGEAEMKEAQTALATYNLTLSEHAEVPKRPAATDGKVTAETELQNLNLSVRSYNCLKEAGCRDVADICRYTPASLGKVRNLGVKSVREISQMLLDNGFALQPDPEAEEPIPTIDLRQALLSHVFPRRIWNPLVAVGIGTCARLATMAWDDVLNIPGLRPNSIAQIRNWREEHAHKFKTADAGPGPGGSQAGATGLDGLRTAFLRRFESRQSGDAAAARPSHS